jgi:hypothetical protein
MRYVIYRAYYSDPKIFEASIRSIDKHADRIFLFWTDRPWGNFDFVEFDGNTYSPPKSLGEATKNVAKAYRGENIVRCIKGHTRTPFNQLTGFANKILDTYKNPDTLIIMEPDHVWREEDLVKALNEFEGSKKFSPVASSGQIELWKPPHVSHYYRVPERPQRTGVVFWDTKEVERLPQTRTQGEPARGAMSRLPSRVFNLGFAVDQETMFWKHVCAIGFSGQIGDSLPNVDWYKKKWLEWDECVKDLEISRGHEGDIATVLPFDRSLLPEALQ